MTLIAKIRELCEKAAFCSAFFSKRLFVAQTDQQTGKLERMASV
jgi:hypothetical protein